MFNGHPLISILPSVSYNMNHKHFNLLVFYIQFFWLHCAYVHVAMMFLNHGACPYIGNTSYFVSDYTNTSSYGESV